MTQSQTPQKPSAKPTSLPWFRSPVFGLAVIVVCLASAAGVRMIKDAPQPPAALGAVDADQGDDQPPADRQARANQLTLIDEQFDLAGLTIQRSLIRDGGPGIDDIPAITTAAARPEQDPHADDPRLRGAVPPVFVPLDQADFLKDDSRVVGVTIDGVSRAYPIAVLNWHECINDVLGGVPIAVIYCPLCDSVTVIDRRVGEGEDAKVLEFGISGLLYNSNVLLYDRQERGLWSQVKLEAVAGPRAGKPLRHLEAWSLTSFSRWRTAHRDSEVLSFKTGYRRNYQRDPYANFATHDRVRIALENEDDRLPRKQRVIGVLYKDAVVAFTLGEGERSIAHTFEDGSKLVMIEDASGGVEIVRQPDDARLVHTYWYAWAVFHPGSQIIE